MTFLISEDNALRKALQGITVTDQKAENDGLPREVQVRFGLPDQEIGKQAYPYIIIDMIDVQRDPQREMRGKVSPIYLAPDNLPDNQAFEIDMPIPVNIDYQITSYSRHPYHDREILSQLLTEKTPIRFGVLELNDGTTRRMDVVSVSKRDTAEAGKRLFVNAITVRVSSEIAQGVINTLYKVLEVNVHDPTVARRGGTPHDPYYVGVGSFNISR